MERTLHFRVVDEGGLRVQLFVCEGTGARGTDPPALEAPFHFDRRESTDRMLEALEAGDCLLDDLKDLGQKLWAALTPGHIGKRVAELRTEQEKQKGRLCFRLELPQSLEMLPWETLYYLRRSTGFIASDPFCSVVRHPPDTIDLPAPRSEARGPLRVLVVIPERSFLNIQAEWNALLRVFGPGGGILDPAGMRRLDQRVTPDKLAKELDRTRFDLVHFIGHGRTLDGETQIRLNEDDGDETWMEAERFAALFRKNPPRLVFLNCCYGGAASLEGSLSGLGPYLLRSGVPSVLAMRYAVPDDTAIKLSSDFYEALLAKENRGRVDLAATEARRALERNVKDGAARSIATPVLFLVPGLEKVVAIEPQPELRAPVERSPGPQRKAAETSSEARDPTKNYNYKDPKIPAELLEAVREGLCVPVIGPGVLPAVRSIQAGLAPSPCALADKLAKDSGFPEMDELRLGEAAGEWLDMLLLQRVCQHVEQKQKRAKLANAVLAAHARSSLPAALLDIAAWPVTGLICTHFDGLMELAFQKLRREVRVVHGVDEAPGMESKAPLLVHMRGSVSSPRSLVLTENDHDELLGRFAHVAAQVAALPGVKLGQSLLFLGVSPRDLYVKRFISQLLTPVVQKHLGPIFFVWRSPSPVDEACWERFGVTWVPGEVEEVVAALTEAAAERAR